MKSLELVKYLAESAAELISTEMNSLDVDAARMDEAEELLTLSARILARSNTVVNEETIQEAA